MEGDKNFKLDVVHFGLKLSMVIKSVYLALSDRGLELYLLVIPLGLMAMFFIGLVPVEDADKASVFLLSG